MRRKIVLLAIAVAIPVLAGNDARARFGRLVGTLSEGPGCARLLLASALASEAGWRAEERRYQELRQKLVRQQPDYRVWQRSPDELWVYDNRPELGIGMHGMTDKQLDLVRALGIRLVRITLYWQEMEKTETPGVYDAKYLRHWDELVARAKKHGVELLVVVHGNPPGVGWATREESYRRFARFMGDMASRYPGVCFWELWNEMDSGFTDLFGAGVNPSVPMRERGKHYARMLKLAYPAIKRANPKALVLAGGMTDWQEFPRGLYEGGGRDYFDIMNLHAYGVPVEWGVVTRGAALRDIMVEHGDSERPFWLTEMGIDAGSLVAAWGVPKGSPAEIGEALDRMHHGQWEGAIRAAFETGLYAKVLPYQFEAGNEAMRDQLADPEFARKHLPKGRTIDDYGFGIVRRDGVTPRPTYEWLKRAQLNRSIRNRPSYRTDVKVTPAPKGVPVGYRSRRQGDTLVIQGVRVDAYAPTQIKLNRE